MKYVYLYFPDSAKFTKRQVQVGDFASICSTDKKLKEKIAKIPVYSFPERLTPRQKETGVRTILTALKVMDVILAAFPELQITPLGSTDIILEFDTHKTSQVLTALKAGILCVITFFGAMFTIMAFNNDVQVHEVFQQLFALFAGTSGDGFSLLELSYSAGLGIGILVFYNHFGKKEFSRDPTPLEIEMRLYENDVNTALIDGIKRKNQHIDVD